jgi:hypothetical protein
MIDTGLIKTGSVTAQPRFENNANWFCASAYVVGFATIPGRIQDVTCRLEDDNPHALTSQQGLG